MKVKKFFRNNFFILGIIWKNNKAAIICKLFLSLMTALITFFDVYTVKWLFDALEEGRDFNYILPLLIAATVAYLIPVFYRGYYQLLLGNLQINKTLKYLNLDLIEKSKNLDLACYENAEFFDKYTRALSDLHMQVYNTFNMMGYFFDALFNLSVIFSLILTLNYWLVIVFVLIAFCQFGKEYFVNKLEYKKNLEATYSQRETQYVSRVMYEPKYAKEIKLYSGLTGELKRMYGHGIESLQSIYMNYNKKSMHVSNLFNILFILSTSVFPWLLIGYQYFYLGITLGTVAALVNTVSKLPGQFDYMMWTFSTFQRNSLYVENLKKILDYKPEIEATNGVDYIPSGAADIEVDNVTFTYRGETKPTLKNINLKINKGEKVAFVGHNGAGKTTMVKLLTRLYDPQEGSIKIAGKSVAEYETDSLRNCFGLVFQDFNLYAMSVTENVLMRQIKDREKDEAEVISALKKAGLYEKVAALPAGINTPVTKEFDSDGLLLSGGETQKLALARVFAKNNDIIILDEPSSALDPIAEHEMFSNMAEASNGKTVILISHRLSSVVNCDKIYYFENGEILECGSHEELMAKNGKYAYMFNVQAEKYNVKVERE